MLYRTMIVFKILKVEDCMTKYSDTERCFLKDVFFLLSRTPWGFDLYGISPLWDFIEDWIELRLYTSWFLWFFLCWSDSRCFLYYPQCT